MISFAFPVVLTQPCPTGRGLRVRTNCYVQITARDSILIDGGAENTLTSLQNNTGSFFNTLGEGNAGSLTLTTPKLIVTNNGRIRADTFNQGNAGDLSIDTDSITLERNGEIGTNTFNQGNAGNLLINAADSVTVDNGQIIADVASNGTGTAGSLTINTKNLDFVSGGQISASTIGAGDAGNVTINAADSLEIIGADEDSFASGIFVVAFNGDGEGGELDITTQDLRIANGGTINVGNFPSSEASSQFPGIGEPGDLNIRANSIHLENGALIDAATRSPVGDGANINIASEDITLDNNALISARAFEEADGGNLSIESGFILAFPDGNNDIVARADRGNGGRISIDTEAIFGLEERLSEPANFTNDIDASSEFGLQGDFSLNTPDFDPTSGLIELPAAVGDVTDQISQNPCQQGVGSQFIVTGKGGLPPNPTENLQSDRITVDLVEPLSREVKTGRVGEKETREEDIVTARVPAMGWVFNDKGEVILTAYSNTDASRERSPQHHTTCQSNLAP